jgi:hypothetical protein
MEPADLDVLDHQGADPRGGFRTLPEWPPADDSDSADDAESADGFEEAWI